MKPIYLFGISSALLLSSCGGGLEENQSEVKELTDEAYPDNNDIESRSNLWDKYQHDVVQVDRHSEKDFTVTFLPTNEFSDTIVIDHINLLEWMPTVPDHITGDEYLKYIGIINAEWNRQQVRFDEGTFRVSKLHEEGKKTVRVDLARNCLNSYAWEIITYTEEDGKQKSMYHGWFDFPKQMYRDLFNEVNKGKLAFEDYADHLEEYKHPEKKVVNLDVLRTVDKEWEVAFGDHRNEFYPKTGARKSKFKNIVSPKNPTKIEDFLNDDTKFSTFQWPGWYDTKDPRTTTLSMLGIPKKVIIRETTSKNSKADKCYEFDVTYARNTDTTYLTRVVIGGVKKESLKQLALEDYNKGFKMPMGIGNHAFYEKQDVAQSNSSSDSPYYGFVLDPEGKWVDSHFFGVDGPLFHLDENDENLMHYWLLSFERHAMVTHLTFDLTSGGVVESDTTVVTDLEVVL